MFADNLDDISFEDFILKMPLYKHFSVTIDNFQSINTYCRSRGAVDSFCVDCGQASVFSTMCSHGNGLIYVYQEHGQLLCPRDWFVITLTCSRNGDHHQYCFYRATPNSIMKAGQYPSSADLQKGDIRKYRSVLGDERYGELSRSVGLFAHGVGVGSFVYLRRIFESLIEEEHEACRREPGWDEDHYSRSRMEEKIDMLRGRLPSFLVDNKSVYSILSLGIHSLSEEECLGYFDVLRTSIELILDERIRLREEQRKIKETQNVLSRIKRRGSS